MAAATTAARSFHDLYNAITLGMIESLEKRPRVVDVKLAQVKPAMASQIRSYEQTNGILLPADFKQFLQVANGMTILWTVRFKGKVLPLGRVHINGLSALKMLDCRCADEEDGLQQYYAADSHPAPAAAPATAAPPSGAGATPPAASASGTAKHPVRYFNCKVVQLDDCDGTGKVALVYRNNAHGEEPVEASPEVWFADRAGNWTMLADSFTRYFRLLILHLGLPDWQYAYTSIGLSPSARQWMRMYAPHRLHVDESSQEVEEKRIADSIPLSDTVMNLGIILRRVKGILLYPTHYTDGLVLVYRAYVREHAVGNNAGHPVYDPREAETTETKVTAGKDGGQASSSKSKSGSSSGGGGSGGGSGGGGKSL